MATAAKHWTLEELHRLPEDDGNKYELVRGELFVTPAPSPAHETIGARLARIIDRYVEAQGLGYTYRPRAIMRFDGSEVEPDLMVAMPSASNSWDTAPTPILVVEIASRTTRRRDRTQKRALYLDAGVEEYWMVDPEDRTITVVRHDRDDVIARDTLTWSPRAASAPLAFDVARVFGETATASPPAP